MSTEKNEVYNMLKNYTKYSHIAVYPLDINYLLKAHLNYICVCG